jgi:hypothetical protein
MSSLGNLEYLPYINTEGKLPTELQGKIGVYAIFDEQRILQYIGYSRDIYLSLKQHLVRQPDSCYWLKVAIIDRPQRTTLENMRTDWIKENGVIPAGNAETNSIWEEPIDVKLLMTASEIAEYPAKQFDDVTKEKFLKNIARRVEAEILAVLKNRGLEEEIRFNPKLKSSGLLDLKP